VWRQVLEVGDVVDRLLIAGRMLLTLSSHGQGRAERAQHSFNTFANPGSRSLVS
jgi:hypothetical protein